MNFAYTKIGTIVLLTVFFGFYPGYPAYAQGNNPNSESLMRGAVERNMGEEQSQQLQERAGELIQNRCQLIMGRIDSRILRFDENQDRHVAKYQQLKERFQALIARLESRGYDVSVLRQDFQELNELIVKFGTDYAVFIQDLRTARANACSTSGGEFANRVRAAKESLDIVRGDVREIRTFYKDTIRQDILGFKEQVRNRYGE